MITMSNASKIEKPRLTTAQDLLKAGVIWDSDYSDIEVISSKYSISVPRHIAKAIQDNPQSDVLWKQFIPQPQELNNTALELNDPIGDEPHSPVKGIVHRYPDRVLFKITQSCAVYCRYCFRREMVGRGKEALNRDEKETALNYIRNNKEIWEVILTGGDPFIYSARQMSKLLKSISEIEHVQVIRVHTRTPISDYSRITDEYINALNNSCSKPLYIVLHVNHTDEITPEVEETIKKLNKVECTLLSQSVLLKDVNDRPATLEALFKKLITLHVKPYYLHHPDMAKGTSHFRMSLKEGFDIYRKLLGKMSGILSILQ